MSELLKGRAHAALMRRWCSMLGCTVARSYALSLVGPFPARADGPTLSIHEVAGPPSRFVKVALTVTL